jgi:CheY-like chemotaxis protein
MPKSVLVADDSLTIRKVVGMLFATEDFALTAVDNGLDAVAKARELRPDLVLADCMMPGKNGYEVCQDLKNDPSTSHIPVLLLAGNFEPFDAAKAQAVGANGHIPKPFDSTTFMDKVRASVGMAPAAAPPNPYGHLGPSTAPAPAPAAPAMRPPAPQQPLQGIQQPRPMPGQAGVPMGTQPGMPPRPGMPPMGQPGMPPGGMPPRPMGVPMGTQPGMPPRPGMPPMGHQPGMPPRPMGQPGMPPMGAQPGMPRPMGVPGMPGTMPPGPGVPRPPMAGTPGMPPAPGMPGGFPRPPGGAPLPGQGLPPRRDPFGLPGQPVGQPPPRAESLNLDHHRPGADGGEAVLREALSKASREVIEKIAWEVVPQLAETIIRQELERLIKDREAKGL